MFAKKAEIKMNFAKSFSLVVFDIILFSHAVLCLEAPQIYIPDQGIIIGTYLKMFRTQNIKAFLGIQYAGAARFSPPEMYTASNNGIYNATSYAADCWQTSVDMFTKQNAVIHQLLRGEIKRKNTANMFDEKCLNLNVFVPVGSPGVNGYAVVVWIHDGDFSHGSAADIDPFQMVFKQKVIVVTVAYRLNIFGFLSTGDGESPGNFGLMDQSAALFWIRKNINYFGGNERHITIMGHSAGAASIGLHLISKEWSKNTFAKAIIMSGNPLTDNVVRTPEEFGEVLDSIAGIFGCPRKPTSRLVQCLRRVDARILAENTPAFQWSPVIDFGLSNSSMPFIEDYPQTLFKKGSFQKVPILMGVTNMEDVLRFVEEENTGSRKFTQTEFNKNLNDIILNDAKRSALNEERGCLNEVAVLDAFYYLYPTTTNTDDDLAPLKNLVSIITDRMYIAPLYALANDVSPHTDVFVYFFNIKPKTQFYKLPDWIEVPKYFDQIYIWGVPYMNNGELVREWNPIDKKISDMVMTLWANFVKSSNPTKSNIYIKWTPYTTENKTFLIINDDFPLKTLDNDNRINFWNNYYPKLLGFAMECCNLTNFASTNYFEAQPQKRFLFIIICILFGNLYWLL